jgi:type I restriction enzyme S subunit
MVEAIEIQKGFKQTEVGVIPSDWEVKKLDDLSNMKSGETITSKIISELDIYPCYGGNGLRGYTYRFTHNGDFALIGRQGALCGNVQYVEGKFFASEHAVVVTTNAKTDIKWLYYILTDMNLNQYSESSAQPGLSIAKILKLTIPLPPTKAEQTAIATVLNDADALITQLEKLIAKKRAIKQGAMQELLKPKEGWELKKLGEILKVRHGKSQKEVAADNGVFPILASGGVIGRAKTFLYDKPSVLIGRKGTIDEPQYMDTPFWSVDTLFYTEINREYDPKFIFYMFNLIDWYSYNEASGVPSLNAKTIELIEKQFPKFEEQTRIAQILSDMDVEIEALEKKLDKYKMLKQGMMQNLLTGKIRFI